MDAEQKRQQAEERKKAEADQKQKDEERKKAEQDNKNKDKGGPGPDDKGNKGGKK